jgi:predicted ribosome quality control (RQC) complex YloA/Tae2 family protein
MSRDDEVLLDERQRKAAELAAAARKAVVRELRKQERLVRNLRSDLEKHGDPERWKRFGDLLLANLSTATRSENTVRVVDYFDETAPEIEIAVEPNLSLSEAAESYFRLYGKARNGREIIERRIENATQAIADAKNKLDQIAEAEKTAEVDLLSTFIPQRRAPTEQRKPKKSDAPVKGVRTFVSSDGFEVLIGRGAAENDYLTFRIAKSSDVWLHAADYPGSHAVIRNPNRKPVPQRTLYEAAAAAAFYSDARNLEKAAVSYTEKKFVNRVKGAPPGKVRLASFRTLLVRPEIKLEPLQR